jgi:glutamine synthetase
VNPYLGIAATLAAGYLGLKAAKMPRPEFKGDAYALGSDIPRSLGMALDVFRSAAEMHEVLGPDFARVYLAVKENENKEYQQVITPWEREHLLLNA